MTLPSLPSSMALVVTAPSRGTPATWTREQARQIVTGTLHADFAVNRRLIEQHDHWQDGALYKFSRSGDAGTDRGLLEMVRPQFTPDDVLSEVLVNYANGLTRREAHVTLDPLDVDAEVSEDEQVELDAFLGAVFHWWDRVKFWRTVRRTLKRSRYAVLRDDPQSARGTLRFLVPPSRLRDADGAAGPVRALPTDLEPAAALRLIECDALPPDAGMLYTDPVTREQAAVLLTAGSEGQVGGEVDIWTLDAGRRAVLRRLPTQGAAERFPPLDLRGWLPFAQVEGETLIIPPVRELQAALNFIATTLPRCVEGSGFKDRSVLNAEPPGIWLPYPPENGEALGTSETEGGLRIWKHRVPWIRGIGMTQEILGVKQVTKDADGRETETYATPSVVVDEPTDPEFITRAMDHVEALIYKRCRQGHLSKTSTAESSGEAYEQARDQFEADLETERSGAEGLVRDALEILLSYAALMSPAARRIAARYRFSVTLHIHTGPITAAKAEGAARLRDLRLISQATAMARAGTEDQVAEQAAIDADPMIRVDFWTKMAAAFSTLTTISGMTAAGAGFLLGLTEEQVQVLETGMPPPPKPGEQPARRLEAVA